MKLREERYVIYSLPFFWTSDNGKGMFNYERAHNASF